MEKLKLLIVVGMILGFAAWWIHLRNEQGVPIGAQAAEENFLASEAAKREHLRMVLEEIDASCRGLHSDTPNIECLAQEEPLAKGLIDQVALHPNPRARAMRIVWVEGIELQLLYRDVLKEHLTEAAIEARKSVILAELRTARELLSQDEIEWGR
jgi:hypothetical protein